MVFKNRFLVFSELVDSSNSVFVSSTNMGWDEICSHADVSCGLSPLQ